MSFPSQLEGLLAVRRAVEADEQGEVRQATGDEAWRPELDAGAAAVALTELGAAGEALGLGALDLVHAKGPSRATVTAHRPDGLLLVELAPGQRSAEVERALAAWSIGTAPPVAAPAASPVTAPAARASVPPRPSPGETTPSASSTTRDLGAPPTPTLAAMPAAAAPEDRATIGPPPPATPWAALRRALARGHLNEAAALLRAIGDAPADPAAGPEAARPDPEAFRADSQRLLEGIGGVLSGDTAGGARILRDLAAPTQANLSLRWLAASWSARAAVAGGSIEVARRHVKDTLDLSRQLDVEARAVSQLVAAELLLRAGETDKALAWLAESRSRFERSRDPWGQARTWLAEARARAAAGSDDACVAAARQASLAEPAWDGPPIFLAGRALTAGDLAAAEALIASHESAAASRVRKLVSAVRQGAVSLEAGAEFLRLHLAPPTTTAMRALERIADASPRFLQAREAQAWMLVKLGRYGDARALFAWLDGQALDPDERGLVSMGLRCVDAALLTAAADPRPAGAAGPAAGSPPRTDTPARGMPVQGSAAGPGNGTVGPSAAAVFSGRLSVFSLPDLIEFLRTARRSGLLVCSSEAGMGSMRFSQGFVTDASAPGTPSLAALLQRADRLTPEVEAALAAAPEGEGEAVLVRGGLVPTEALEAVVRTRVDLVVRELVRWGDGEFAFNKEPDRDDGGAPPVLVDAQELLLNLFREQDESSRGPAAGGAAS